MLDNVKAIVISTFCKFGFGVKRNDDASTLILILNYLITNYLIFAVLISTKTSRAFLGPRVHGLYKFVALLSCYVLIDRVIFCHSCS